MCVRRDRRTGRPRLPPCRIPARLCPGSAHGNLSCEQRALSPTISLFLAGETPMATAVLTTKLYVPPVRPTLVPRPRLTERLRMSLAGKLTLIAAPAGFGKTTLLAAWLADLVQPVAWLSLDGGDNDPSTFLRYLVAQAGPIHEAVLFLLDHLPPQLHLVIASRADPPLPLARLRGRGHLTELRAADLRFTPAEAAAFLTEVMQVPLGADDVAALETRTEGWIAGLQLAALAMRDR